jgi:hypothetical protein
VQALQTGTEKGAYPADAFVNPANLQVITLNPMTSAGSFSFKLPSGQPAAFVINWPTASRGYGLVVVDNGGSGFSATATVNFTYQAAKDILRKLNAALAARPDYVWSANFTALYSAATNCVAAADASSVDSVRGAQGQLALEQLAVAYDTLLKEYGPFYARSHQSTTMPWLGFTMEDVSNYQSDMNKLKAMAGPYAWVRIVFQKGTKPSDYTTAVAYAKSIGIKVMGLCVDSSDQSGYTRAQYLAFYQQFITAFPTIDCWEVGNEVNGSWVTPVVGAEIADVAAYCKSLGKKTFLTLFWQINTDDNAHSLFNWIANATNLPASVRANIDYIGMSQYQEPAPMGTTFDQVMRLMQTNFPTQGIGLGELGYWISGQQYWWAYSGNVTTAKDDILAQYYDAVLGYQGAIGACFWWNFSSTGSDPDFDSSMSNSIDALNVYLQSSVVQTPPPPTLSIAAVKGGVNISWPVSATGYVLYSAPVGQNPPQWTLVPTIEYVIGDALVTFPAATSTGSYLFRLYHP